MNPEASVCNPLERMLIDETAEPTNLRLPLLECITNNFSDDMKIGTGGFAVVYKGLLQNGTVAVKKLTQTLDDAKFQQEVYNMLSVKHKNVVRFLGYCSNTQETVQKFNGRNVMAEDRYRFLCFEFLPLGGLDKYIHDAAQGPEWMTRYQIIKGICEGLHYLHQKNIVHLDLKPANILLDHYMVPKIADFGLSRCFDENQTRTMTAQVLGTLGYMAPESYDGLITFKSDIYSLGVIIIEILTGQKGYPNIDNIRESWSARFETSLGDDIRLGAIQVCAEIGIECTDSNPAKRPDTQRIIERLAELEREYSFMQSELLMSATNRSDGKKPVLYSSTGTRSAKQMAKEDGGARAEAGRRGGKLVHFDKPLTFTADDLLYAQKKIICHNWNGIVHQVSLKDRSMMAIKWLMRENIKGHKEFEAEAAVLGKIRHPHLLALRAYYVKPNGWKMLVFDYMQNGSLSAWRARAPMDWETRMTIAMGTACGLAYLHNDMNIIQVYLTADNVLLDEQGNPKIAEFELSRLMTADAKSKALAAVGKLGYRAPELWKVEEANAKTDVYSLGVIILELLTGKSAADRTNGMDLPQWVASMVKAQRASDVFDPKLMRNAAVWAELVPTLKLALQCVDPSPSVRPEAREVLRQLEQISPESDGGVGPSEEGHVPLPAGGDDE